MLHEPVPMRGQHAEAPAASAVRQSLAYRWSQERRHSGQGENVLIQRMALQVDLAAPGAAHNHQAYRSAGAS